MRRVRPIGLLTLLFPLLLWAGAANAVTCTGASPKVCIITHADTSPWSVPADWNSASNTIQIISAGGNGRNNGVGSGGGGGGGGGYCTVSNVALTPGGSAYFQVGQGGGNAGTTGPGATWFNGTTLAGSSVGIAGASNANNGFGANGASTTGSVGTCTSGMNGATTGVGGVFAGYGGGGGGASAGVSGHTGTAPTAGTTSVGGNGGQITGGGALGAGATSSTAAAVGSNGTDITSSSGGAGSGGGGGGGAVSGVTTYEVGANGGLYGGGGGGSYNSAGTGTGGNGVIVVSYMPGVPAGYIQPGTLAPAPGGGAWQTCAQLSNCPGNQGTNFAGETPTVAWEIVPGTVFNGGTVQICVIGGALISNVSGGNGTKFGQSHVDFQVNGGPITSVTTFTTSPYTGEAAACAPMRLSDLNYSHGKFEVRAIWYPVDGLPQVLQPADGPSCSLYCALDLFSNSDGLLYASNGTVYLDPTNGSDANNCSSHALACKTPCRALAQLASNVGSDLSNTRVLISAGTVSSIGTCSVQYNTASGGWITFGVDTANGGIATTTTVSGGTDSGGSWTPGSVSNTAGNVTWTDNTGMNAQMIHWDGINFDFTGQGLSVMGTGMGNRYGTGSQGWMSNTIFKGPNQYNSMNGPFQQFTEWGRTFFTEATIENIGNGCINEYFNRNVHETYIGSDSDQNCHIMENVHVDNDTPLFGVLLNNTQQYGQQFSSTAGQAVVQAAVDPVSMGMYVGLAVTDRISGGPPGVCLPNTTNGPATVQSIDSVHNTFTLSLAAPGTCTGFYVSTAAHPDLGQYAVSMNDIIMWDYGTDGTTTPNSGTVLTDGAPFTSSGSTVHNFMAYKLNSSTIGSTATNYKSSGYTNFNIPNNAPTDNFKFVDSQWVHGDFTNGGVNQTNFTAYNVYCARNNGQPIPNTSAWAFYADPATNHCH